MAYFTEKAHLLEAVQFNGSSTCRTRIKNWIEGGEYPGGKSYVDTCDIRNLEFNNKDGRVVVRSGDYVVKYEDGTFGVIRSRDIAIGNFVEVEKK